MLLMNTTILQHFRLNMLMDWQFWPFNFCRNCSRIGVYDQDQRVHVVEFNYQYFSVKNTFHTLLHVLGKYHEHQRPDRDQYITIQWQNIKPGIV